MGFLSFGMKNDPKTHIMWFLPIPVTKTPGKWISLYVLPRNKPFMSFPGKFSTNINVSMGFSVFWAKNGSKHVLCHIYPSQQQNTWEMANKWTCYVSPRQFLAIIKVSIVFCLLGQKLPGKHILWGIYPFRWQTHLRDWLFICTFNDRFEKGKEDKVQALFLYWEYEYWEIEICEFASFNCILFILTQKHAWYPPDSWCKTRLKWSLGIINWVLYFNK